MKIEIKGDDKTLTLNDDELDNDAFVDISIDDVVTTINIDELMSAVIAFDSKRSRRLAEEEHYD